MGFIKIENTIAQQENYDDIAEAFGFTGTAEELDEFGNPVYNIIDNELVPLEDGSYIKKVEISSQEFIARLYKNFSNEVAQRACHYQQELQGKLNYNAEERAAMFMATTKVTWEE